MIELRIQMSRRRRKNKNVFKGSTERRHAIPLYSINNKSGAARQCALMTGPLLTIEINNLTHEIPLLLLGNNNGSSAEIQQETYQRIVHINVPCALGQNYLDGHIVNNIIFKNMINETHLQSKSVTYNESDL
uniref:Uncharacterized protein n=1 Tax=Romanomermis culicivorax TaxID=13658 RepID=A0A915KHW8_ROMCU